MSKHTPGPWSVGGTRHYKHSGGIDGTEVAIHYGEAERRGNCIAHCYGHGNLGDAEADARLIAAAPELLEACLAMIEWDDRENDHAVNFQKRMELCELSFQKARAAIAKATGENT